MRIFTVIFCLLVSVGAWGQVSDAMLKDTSKKIIIRDAPANPDFKPLIILDDSVYNGTLNSIDPNSIISLDVFKGLSATAIYGKQAASGVIVIKTKNYRQIDTAINKDALFVIDGQPSKNRLDGINPKDILSIDILKKGKDSDPSFEPVNDVVIVVTKANAIKQYQKKFSAFSKKYKSYLEHHQNNDTDFLYVVDGIQIQGKPNEIISKLYKIPMEKIKEVGFDAEEQTDRSPPLVIINTKQ